MKHVFCLADCESSTLIKTGPKEDQLWEEEDGLCLGYSGYPGGAAHLKSPG